MASLQMGDSQQAKVRALLVERQRHRDYKVLLRARLASKIDLPPYKTKGGNCSIDGADL